MAVYGNILLRLWGKTEIDAGAESFQNIQLNT
jgi:hypothetical protein